MGQKQRKPGRSHDQRGKSGKPRPSGPHGRPDGGKLRPAARETRGISLRSPDGYFLFGRNSVEAALKNPARECVQLIGTEKALDALTVPLSRQSVKQAIVDSHAIETSVPVGAPHQSILLEVRPLLGISFDELAPIEGQKNIILMLDQVTDPQNVGACLRSAAAFGARALITQDRNSPSETGTLARASAGALETLPWLAVTNLSQTLERLKDMGYWHVGLDGNTDTSIRDIKMGDNLVVVMGSEGSGLRPLVRKNCDAIARIPMTDAVESLNVSAAASIALYELSQ